MTGATSQTLVILIKEFGIVNIFIDVGSEIFIFLMKKELKDWIILVWIFFLNSDPFAWIFFLLPYERNFILKKQVHIEDGGKQVVESSVSSFHLPSPLRFIKI